VSERILPARVSTLAAPARTLAGPCARSRCPGRLLPNVRRGLHTIGMRQFGRMEIEIERSSWGPPELYALAKDVANYILTP
jgi:hypothetical protein